MATFPALRTNASAQYPVRSSLRQRIESVRFLDGSDQRFANARMTHEWTIDLRDLDEAEIQAIQLFFDQQDGTLGIFTFTDPVTGSVYNNCRFVGSSFSSICLAPGRVQGRLTIQESVT